MGDLVGMRPEISAVVDAWWAGIFGCPVEELWRPGIHLSPHHGLGDYSGIYVLAHAATCRISAPAAVLPQLAEIPNRRPASALFTAELWREFLGGRVQVVHGPSEHFYLGSTADLPPPVEVDEVPPSALEPLRIACGEGEWGESGFPANGSAEAACTFGLWRAGTLVAAANLTPWRDRPSDIGLLTHPAHRGRGYGFALAGTVARLAVESAGIARYRALSSNTPSLRVARRLRFTGYGRNLAVRLTPGDGATPPRG